MPGRVSATPAALELIGRLRAAHGDVVIHLSGGCCDGSSPMCLRARDLPPSPHDLRLGELAGAPVLIDAEQDRRWRRPCFHIDVDTGAGSGFSLEGLEDLRFTVTSAALNP